MRRRTASASVLPGRRRLVTKTRAEDTPYGPDTSYRTVSDHRTPLANPQPDISGDDAGNLTRAAPASSSSDAFIIPDMPDYDYRRDIAAKRKRDQAFGFAQKSSKNKRTNQMVQPRSAPVNPRPWENSLGHHMHTTGNIGWCIKCGAFVEMGNTARYLRIPCLDRPPTAMLRKQRDSLLRNLHPITRVPLNSSARRVRM